MQTFGLIFSFLETLSPMTKRRCLDLPALEREQTLGMTMCFL